MPTISVPSIAVSSKSDTSIGIDGPLGSLVYEEDRIKNIYYPLDLGTASKGHYVLFTIKEIDPVTWDTIQNIKNQLNDVNFSSIESAVQTIEKKTAEVVQIAQQRIKNVATISLYMPETVNFSYNAHYNELTLVDAASSLPLVGGLIGKAASIMENNAAKLILNKAGYVFNPQQQLLFQGVDFRKYQMSFTFTPTSKKEAESVKNIIQIFRQYAAPSINRGSYGMFFTPPGVVDIDFKFNDKTNLNINKVATSVIDSIDVNYSPNGWAAHTDGAPVQTVVTMSFIETSIIDRAKIKDGY